MTFQLMRPVIMVSIADSEAEAAEQLEDAISGTNRWLLANYSGGDTPESASGVLLQPECEVWWPSANAT